MTKRAVLAVLGVAAVLAAGCGGTSADGAAPPSTTAPTTSAPAATSTTAVPPPPTAEPTTTTSTATTVADVDTTEPAAKRDDPKARAKVKGYLNDFVDDHRDVMQALADVSGQTMSIEEDDVDSAIDDACKAKPNDYRLDDETLGALTLFVGQTLVQHGSDVATFATDMAKLNRKVGEAAGC